MTAQIKLNVAPSFEPNTEGIEGDIFSEDFTKDLKAGPGTALKSKTIQHDSEIVYDISDAIEAAKEFATDQALNNAREIDFIVWS